MAKRKTLIIPKKAIAPVQLSDHVKLMAKSNNDLSYLDPSNIEHIIGVQNFGVTLHPTELFNFTNFNAPNTDNLFKNIASYATASSDNMGTKSFGTVSVYVPTGTTTVGRIYSINQKPIRSNSVFECKARFSNISTTSTTYPIDNYINGFATLGYSQRTVYASTQGAEIGFMYDGDINNGTIKLTGYCSTDASNKTNTTSYISLVNTSGFMVMDWYILRFIIAPDRSSVRFKIFSYDLGTQLLDESITTNIPAENNNAFVQAYGKRKIAGGSQFLIPIDYMGYGSINAYKNLTGVNA